MAALNDSESSKAVLCMSLASSNLPSIYHHLSLGIGFAILSIATIFSNSVLIYTLQKTRQLNTISNKLTLLMNISDLCQGLITFPISAFMNLRRGTFKSCTTEKAFTYLSLHFVYYSGFMLLFIAIDRYFRVTKLNRYNLYMNNVRMKIMVIVGFIVSGINAALSTLNPSFPGQVAAVIFGLVLMIFGMVVYIILLRRLQSHVKRREIIVMSRAVSNIRPEPRVPGVEVPHVNTAACDKPQEDKMGQLSAVNTIKFLLIYVVVIYTPYQIMSCFWTYYRFLKKTEPGAYVNIAYVWSGYLAMFNASGNSWIILYVNTRSRRFVSKLFRPGRIEDSTDD